MSRCILISGAGSGIGRAAAIDLAKTWPDTELVLVGRRAGPLEETAEHIGSKRVTIVMASQADQRDLSAALKKADLPKRNLVAVVANAGVGGDNRYGEGDRWSEIIETNLTGTYYLIQECLPALLASSAKAKNVVIISSILARLGVPGYTAYCASKAGLLGLMRSYAATFAKKGLYFNAICPGWVDTDMARQGIQIMADATKRSYEDALAEQMAYVPTGKMSTPEEIASLASYLITGPQTSFTGQCFDMNNGALMP
jgi:NAD(P)-dependent dehydrogenase (short-subunit alcohol dehydrogenase family)